MMSHPPDEPRQALSPPRFSLRGMLVVVSVLCVLFAAFAGVGAHLALGLLLIVLSIAAHLAGAALGNQLRDHGSRPLHSPDGTDDAGPRRRQPNATDFAPQTNLGERKSLGWPLLIGSSVGGVFGLLLGGIWITIQFADRATPGVFAVGGLACGLLGAFAAFLAVSFCQVLLRAVRDAQKST